VTGRLVISRARYTLQTLSWIFATKNRTWCSPSVASCLRVKEKPVEKAVVPEVPEGSGVLAVWIDGDKRVAVMTDGMVREGEVWGVFAVEKITPDSVTLSHAGGERVLKLGEIRAIAVTAKAVVTAPKDGKAPVGSAEEQLQKIMGMQKSMDSSKLLQGFPQQILDSLMGNQKKAVETK
jgi:hypothetical protein